ncbi:Alpha/Beta hydrolase protein [Mycena crocata]|nr:Alpha/Beta hydrolase protein [Mycena crocata]
MLASLIALAVLACARGYELTTPAVDLNYVQSPGNGDSQYHATSDAATLAPIVDLGYAQYQGTVDAVRNITTLLGIRYAAAPTGNLRFRAPQPPASVSGLQHATTQPNRCFKASVSGGLSATNPMRTLAGPAESEDCLFLNVHYPSNAKGEPVGGLPVIVWIHGNYVTGAANRFNGDDLIRQSKGRIVAVIIQYRLGVFGFLPGAAVNRDGALNAGLLDQDFALRWVNRHISMFGGDPSKVTIWGESAGAGSVLQHIVANNGETKPQLFRGAISSSLYLPSQYRFDHRIPEFVFSKVVAATNCTNFEDTMACLRAIDGTLLGAVNARITDAGFSGTQLFAPVIDGTFITQRPTLSLLEGKVNGKALLAVTNEFEGNIAVNQSTTVTAAQYAFELFPGFSRVEAAAVRMVYEDLGTPLSQINAVVGESIFVCPTYSLLRAFPGHAFKGEFALPPALHGDDVWYYFPTTFPPPFNNTAFIDAFAQAFTSFAISLDPNVKVDPATITPRWKLWDRGHVEMLFNKTEGGVASVHPIKTSNALLERCRCVVHC